ncbi:MAG: hypothetical protein LBR89_02505 [Holosporales bacterium]|jgi:hypothetical protein|nr:hypothetical protein [Holosporales bacterium]
MLRILLLAFIPSALMSSMPLLSVKRDQFSKEEDYALRTNVELFGTDWTEIAARMPGRNVRQCRERWKHYISRETYAPITQEESLHLCNLYVQFGPKWTQIAARTPGRTDLDVKNFIRSGKIKPVELRSGRKATAVMLPPAPPPSVPVVAKEKVDINETAAPDPFQVEVEGEYVEEQTYDFDSLF